MERNGITSKITGDNYRDYKKYLEIQKMNSRSNNIFGNDNTNNIINNNNLINNGNINNRNGNRASENQINQNNNPMNITANSTNSRVPFVYIPMNRPPSSDLTKKNNINFEEENKLVYQNNNNSKTLNPNLNYIENLDENKKPFMDENNGGNNINNNLGNSLGNNVSNKQILNEINNLKMILSRTMKNQTEAQNKIMEYDKIINEQENIIRLNNLKLNEHDNKLTEILLSFNNYLQLNEKTSMIINDAQKKMDNFVKGSDFIDLKSSVYNLNKENENKINELNSLCGDLENKLTEMRKENESYQKFTLEKMKQIQKDSMETRLQQQNELIKMEDAKDNRINAQLSQLKNLISINDKNIKEEQEYRKTMINDLRNETLNIFAEKDDQLSKLERNQLETEKNLISLNKDYIQSFNELINKNNEKYNYELKSVRSLIEAGLTKVDIKMEKDLKTYEENLTILKSNILEQKTNIANLDTFLKESINDIENKMELSKGTNNDYFNKFDLLSNSFKQFMEESLNIINTKTKEVDDNLKKLIGEEINKLDDKFRKNSEQSEKHFNDIDEKIIEIKEQLINIIKEGKFDDIKEKEDIKDGKVQEYIVESELRITKKYDEIIRNIKEDLESLTIKIGLGP